jgi:hypothetical protein
MFRLGFVFMAFKIDGQFVYNIFVLRKVIFIYLVLKFNTYQYLFNNKCFYIKNLIKTKILCATRNTDSFSENIPVGHINVM